MLTVYVESLHVFAYESRHVCVCVCGRAQGKIMQVKAMNQLLKWNCVRMHVTLLSFFLHSICDTGRQRGVTGRKKRKRQKRWVLYICTPKCRRSNKTTKKMIAEERVNTHNYTRWEFYCLLKVLRVFGCVHIEGNCEVLWGSRGVSDPFVFLFIYFSQGSFFPSSHLGLCQNF